MVASRNSIAEKGKESKNLKKKAKKIESPKRKKEEDGAKKNNNKTNNGTLKNSKVKDGSEITKTPTSKAKSKSGSKQKRKREQNGEVEEKEEGKVNVFPTDRIRRIIRSENNNDFKITSEAIFLINVATEKFLEKFCEDAYAHCVKKDRMKSLAYNHLSSVVSKKKRYDFLSDFVPEMIKAENALAERNIAG